MTMGRFTHHAHNPQPDISICEISFCAWVAQAAANDVLVYHRGFLAVDTDTPLAGLSPEEQRALRRLADAAFRAADSSAPTASPAANLFQYHLPRAFTSFAVSLLFV